MELPGLGGGAEAGTRLIKLGFNPWHSQEEPPKPLGMAPNPHPCGVKQKQEQDWVGPCGTPLTMSATRWHVFRMWMAKVDEAVSMGTPFTITMWSPVLGGEQGLREESGGSVSPAPTFVQDLQELVLTSPNIY